MLDKNLTLLLYLVVFVFSLTFVCFANKTDNKRKQTAFLIIGMIPLWLLNVFRSYNVGIDTIPVANKYVSIVNNINISNYNWFGYPLQIVCKILGFVFGPNPFWFIFLIGSLFICFLYIFLKNNIKYSFLYLALIIIFGFYLQSFNQSRQMLSLMIILYSSKYIEKENIFKYFLCILFASIFHSSALIFIPMYFMKNLKINHKILAFGFVGTFIVMIFNPIIPFILKFTKYSIYLTTQYNVSFAFSTFMNLIVRLIMFYFCMRFRNKINNNKINNFSYNMIFICTLLQFLTIRYYFIARLTTYFYAFYVILIPQCFEKIMEKLSSKNKMLFVVIIAFILFSYFIVYYMSKSGAVGSMYEIYDSILFN